MAPNRRWWTLGALALGLVVVGLDITVLNVALPTLAVDLNASTGQLQWFANAYNLALAAALLPAGLLGDRFGRRRLLLLALALFGAASLACAYAGSAGQLIAARAVLGLAAAFLLPLSISVLPVLFSEQERPKAIAVWASANALGLPLGPVLGGWLLDTFWWGSVFLIALPLIAVALLAVAVLLPESRGGRRPGLDPVGVLASSSGLAALTYGLIRAGEHGWADTGTLGALLAGLVGLAAFALGQRGLARRPGVAALVDPTLFRSPRFTWGAALATMVSFAFVGVLFVVPQYLQAVLGAGMLGTGLRLLPLIGGLVVGAQMGDRLGSRTGVRALVAGGFGLLATGLAGGAVAGAHPGYGLVAGWLSVIGLGLGFALPATMDTAMSALSADRSAAGSALLMALRTVGGTLGVAVLGTVLNTGYRSRLDVLDRGGLPEPVADAVRRGVSSGVAAADALGSAPLAAAVRAAFVSGMSGMLVVSAAVAVTGAALTLAFLPERAPATAADGPAPRAEVVT